MKSMRRIMGDRLTAGFVAALVAYVLLIQGFVSAFATGALAAPQPGSTFVICSLTGVVPGSKGTVDGSPLERAVHGCCAALCSAASSHAPILPIVDHSFVFVAEAGTRLHFQSRHTLHRPSLNGLLPEARAPPQISI